MRLPDSASGKSQFRFNITPMIDVVFLLIIFFLVASYFIRSEQSRKVALPTAGLGSVDDSTSQERLTVTVERDGQWSVGGQIEPHDAVFRRIEELAVPVDADPTAGSPEVRIRSDREARFSEIRELIEKCAQNNIRRIRFAVTRPDTAPSRP
jgi:biopolymer transport protein ExbD